MREASPIPVPTTAPLKPAEATSAPTTAKPTLKSDTTPPHTSTTTSPTTTDHIHKKTINAIKERLPSIIKNIEILYARQYSVDSKEDHERAQFLKHELDLYKEYLEQKTEKNQHKIDELKNNINKLDQILVAHDRKDVRYYGQNATIVTPTAGQTLDDAINQKLHSLTNGAASKTALSASTTPASPKTTEQFTTARIITYNLDYATKHHAPATGHITQSYNKANEAETKLHITDAELNEKRIKPKIGLPSIPNSKLMKLAKVVIENQRRINNDNSKEINIGGNHPALVEAAKIYCEYKGYPYEGKGNPKIKEQAKAFAILVEKKKEKKQIFETKNTNETDLSGLRYSSKKEEKIEEKVDEIIEASHKRSHP